MHLGEWEGLTPQEVDARFDNAYQRWRVQPSSVVIPGAESVQDFRARVRRALERLVDGRPDGEHAVVSHGGVIASVLADLLDADYDQVIRRVRLDNAGVTALEFGRGLPHVAWINSTIHLEPLGSTGVTWF
jgi:broad specificity phosphatase PhoE